MKKLINVWVMMAIVLVMAGCTESEINQVSGDGEETEQTENNANEENAESGEEEAGEEEAEEEQATTETFGVGDTVQFNNLEITLVGARTITDDLFEPENDKYIAVELHIVNTGEESESITTMGSMSMMADGYQQDQALVDTKGSLDGEIGPGRELKGEIAFDVTEQDMYEFIYEDMFASGQAIWEIQSSDIE